MDVGPLQASFGVYLLLDLIGAFPGSVIEVKVAPSFMKRFAFSQATLSSAGSAEIVAATAFGNYAASVRAIAGQIDPAVVVARRVGIKSATDTRTTGGPPE